MEFQFEHRDGRWWAAGDMTIYFAAQMKEQLLGAMQARGADVLLDLSQVVELDTCGVQILLMAERLVAKDGCHFDLVEPSVAARDALHLCGLDELVSHGVKRQA